MRIGILSLNPGHNYGGILQSYALKTVLERMGHEVSVISKDRKKDYATPKMFLKYGYRLIKRFVFKRQCVVFREIKHNRWIDKTYGRMLSFCDTRLNIRKIRKLQDINSDEFDAIVVGSDQVWRPRYFIEQVSTDVADAYLNFANEWNVRRIAYAPSFGVDKWEYAPEESIECAQLLQKFDAVSLREQTGVKLCEEHFNVDALCLCDPTMLLTKEDYEILVDDSVPTSKGNLLVYCLDESEEINNLVKRISKQKAFVPFSTNIDEFKHSCEKGSVESWIRGFIDAEFVITDSFHACVFSLIFRKPFAVLGNKDRGMARFESLLKTFNQEKRLLINTSEFTNSLLDASFETVGQTFADLRKDAINFLNKTLA